MLKIRSSVGTVFTVVQEYGYKWVFKRKKKGKESPRSLCTNIERSPVGSTHSKTHKAKRAKTQNWVYRIPPQGLPWWPRVWLQGTRLWPLIPGWGTRIPMPCGYGPKKQCYPRVKKEGSLNICLHLQEEPRGGRIRSWRKWFPRGTTMEMGEGVRASSWRMPAQCSEV